MKSQSDILALTDTHNSETGDWLVFIIDLSTKCRKEIEVTANHHKHRDHMYKELEYTASHTIILETCV